MAQNMPVTANPAQQTATNMDVIEQDIREICAEVLRRPVGKIKLDRSFVAQGGDSILAIKLMARCGEAGYIITINDMLQATSIRKLCQSVKRAEGSSAPEESRSPTELEGPAKDAELSTIPMTRAQSLYASVNAWSAKVFQLEGDVTESALFTALH